MSRQKGRKAAGTKRKGDSRAQGTVSAIAPDVARRRFRQAVKMRSISMMPRQRGPNANPESLASIEAASQNAGHPIRETNQPHGHGGNGRSVPVSRHSG